MFHFTGKNLEYYDPLTPDADIDSNPDDEDNKTFKFCDIKKSAKNKLKQIEHRSSIPKNNQSNSSGGHDKRHSVVTDSTAETELSAATTSGACDISANSAADGYRSRDRRRCAINITSNPGYQVHKHIENHSSL